MERKGAFVFEADKDVVLKKIAMNSFYRGERLKEDQGVHAARVQTGCDNDDILSDEMELAVADVELLITNNLGICTTELEGNKYLFYASEKSSFPYDKLKKTIERLIESYVYNRVLEGWMSIMMPDEMQALGQRSVVEIEKLKRFLVEREKPV